MSHYRLEPKHTAKESFLNQNGTLVSNDMDWFQVPWDHVAVVLIQNVDETIALIAINRREFDRTRSPSDRRERKTYIIAITKILSSIQDRECETKLRERLDASIID